MGIEGNIITEYTLKGKLSLLDQNLIGKLNPSNNVLKGKLTYPDSVIIDDYEGPYEVTPIFENITLNTMGLKNTQNITVYSIPYSEEENEYGGLTITIG